ncbi:MAG: hypothetical protein PHV03_10695 [Desulfitobacteriaceae bacterium]|nr:hypothetical protein [Desulfitobacteriaceae bacterium]
MDPCTGGFYCRKNQNRRRCAGGDVGYFSLPPRTLAVLVTAGWLVVTNDDQTVA